jgi:hypothetical protein
MPRGRRFRGTHCVVGIPGFRTLLLTLSVWLVLANLALAGDDGTSDFEPVTIPAWVHDVTKMAFCTPGEIDLAAESGVQVVHFNAVWPYYPLKRDGGRLPPEEDQRLREIVAGCHSRGMKAVLGLPPFMPAGLVKAHPDWRVHSDAAGSILAVAPDEQNLGTRLGCNAGPWGDYFIEQLVDLVEDYNLDGYSFDGNYHPPICHCPHCRAAYPRDTGRDLPPAIDLDNVEYRQYLVWRGEQLEDYYRRTQQRLKGPNPDTVVMSWTVNAGRYGQLLTSPRSMSARMNLLLDLPMQEWWLDETNFGASAAAAFGSAYIRSIVGSRPAASEPYLMSRGNPYGTDSFPAHERFTRGFLALTNGSLWPEAFSWPGHKQSAIDSFTLMSDRAPWLTRTERLPWAALLVSEQTRQFYAYRDIAERYLPHLFGTFRVGMEEHLALDMVNDWDLTPERLARQRVLVLANAAALSDEQVAAIRQYVHDGGGLVATAETSLFDELGRPRNDFALADLFGVSYRGRPSAPSTRPELDANFAITVNEDYWRQRTGLAMLSWAEGSGLASPEVERLVPLRNVRFRGPLLAVSEPADASEVALRMTPEGSTDPALPGAIVRRFGQGRVVYLPAAIDAGLWSYAYPYQREMLATAIRWAAGKEFAIGVEAPMCVQTTFWRQSDDNGQRIVVHLFNGVNTTANHGLPVVDVPLREETVPVHGIRLTFRDLPVTRFHIEPGGIEPVVRNDGNTTIVELPPLDIHAMLIAEEK